MITCEVVWQNWLPIISSIILLLTAIIYGWQTLVLRRSSFANAFIAARNILQSESVRNARAIIFALKDKDMGNWTKEELKAAQKVCHTYDSIGIMVRNKILPEKFIIDHYCESLAKTWEILEPLVEKYREEREFPGFWDDYEWLAKKGIEYYRR
jgi:hypothetical protein